MQVQLDAKELIYSGRIDIENPKKPEFIYPASFVQFSFIGKRAVLTVKNKRLYWNNSLGAIIDGKQYKFNLNDVGTTEIELINELEDKEHNILVFKRMDSCHIFSLEELQLSDGSVLLPCKNKMTKRIEVYGDSVSAGEVSEAVDYVGKEDPVDHNGKFSNSWYSYPWIFARKYNAELHNISQGGIPLMNGTGWVSPPTYMGMEFMWDKVNYHPELDKVTMWDFGKYTPHIVIIAVGQNCSNPNDFMAENPDGEMAKVWKSKYKHFVLNIRSKYPKALILLTTTLLMHNENWDNAIEEVYQELKTDDKIKHFLYSRNGIATPGHIRISEAEEMADELALYIENLDFNVWEE